MKLKEDIKIYREYLLLRQSREGVFLTVQDLNEMIAGNAAAEKSAPANPPQDARMKYMETSPRLDYGFCKKLCLRFRVSGKKCKDFFFFLLHLCWPGWKWFFTYERSNTREAITWFFLDWIIKRGKLSPETRALLISELLRMSGIDGMKAGAYCQQNKGSHQSPYPCLSHLYFPDGLKVMPRNFDRSKRRHEGEQDKRCN